jgi:hypothetical protein
MRNRLSQSIRQLDVGYSEVNQRVCAGCPQALTLPESKLPVIETLN